ncbi:MAG: FKBP-type peptidyl-prolyl cis-trans isomerase, partial [Chlamydiota bacterium]|nr:FKBP-type peptidyl-prolyl cis-trans isomerase [Chlamydiota bacterium]
IPLSQTVIGFQKGLSGMQKNEKRILYLHPNVAYGLGGTLPPNSLLIFEVDLIDFGNISPAKDEVAN